MAKKYKFKLAGLLKLREFAEEKAKIELGRVNLKIQEVDEAIEQHKRDVITAYESQEEVLKNPTDGRFLQFYPRYFKAKEAAIKDLQTKRMALEKEAQERMQDLLKARAEMKIMEKLKEKDFSEWKKERNKELDAAIEENTQLWLANIGAGAVDEN